MSQEDIEILQRALKRERAARKAAEKILEDKSRELYSISKQLKEHLEEKTNTLNSVFKNINDAYIVMDLFGNVLKMNDVAVEVFGFDIKEESFNVSELVYKEDVEYTVEAFKELYDKGFFKDYTARIVDKHNNIKWIEVNSSIIYDKENKPIAAQGIIRDITEWVTMKELLEEQKNQLSIIINNSPIGITLSKVSEDGVLLVNNSLVNMLGYNSEDFDNIKVDSLTHPDDIEKSKELSNKLNSGKINTFNLEKRYLKKNGDILWAKTTVTAVKDKNNIIKYHLATIEDIHKEILDKEKLIESENRLSALVLNLNSGIVLEDENRKIILSNRKFCELLNINENPNDLIGIDSKLFAEQNKSLFKTSSTFVQRMDEIVKNKTAVFDEELEMVDGKTLSRSYTPVIVKGNIKGFLWKFNDITLEKNYKISLEVQRTKYSSIIANMNLGLVELDNDSKILMINQSFSDMSGYKESELIGKVGSDVFTEGESKEKLEKEREKRLNGNPGSFEVEVKNRKGETKYWMLSAASNYNLLGDIIGTIAIVYDITEFKKLQLQKEIILNELKEKNEELYEYAHIVSHDLKSPLRSIQALVSWIKTDNQDGFDEMTNQNFDLIDSTIETMETLISNVLEYSSIGAGEIEVVDVDLNELVKDLKQFLYLPSNISINIKNTLPVVLGDKTKLQQVFQNFISNAIKFCDKEEGIIEVGSLEKEEHYQFYIKDNGIGIEKKYHDKIFKVFHSLNKREDSTGIGLSIIKKIIDLYGGKIWLESEPTVGTTFYFTIKKQ
ncbi:PAS domain-containing sensor histidine kinase [Polaribacter sargassicola]|uniref:PAS domain-containing sensor histidine kinase n=1 Tax=Polaribacter sargassicola TaxID=2836891 RepID=UPI001F243C4D|nr:PAS domain S-box protein [Polaribacter sp. DS7-9]MCG1037258.1 PAS domain S-box protein [Polaribacter sp. DS7-9]